MVRSCAHGEGAEVHCTFPHPRGRADPSSPFPVLGTHSPLPPLSLFQWHWLLQNSQNSLRKSLFTSRCSAARCDRGAETRAHPGWLNPTLAMGLLLTRAQGCSPCPSPTAVPKLLPAPRGHWLCSPSGRTSPGQGGLCTDTTPWATLRHYKYTGAIQRFRKTHSECKHFCTYSHWTSTHEVFCCFLDKS